MVSAFRNRRILRNYLNSQHKRNRYPVILVLAGLLSMALSPTATAGEYQKLADACFACHGQNGDSKFETIPSLRWQNKDHLVQQLQAFKNGSRKDKTMSKVALLLSDDDINRLAEHFYTVEEK